MAVTQNQVLIADDNPMNIFVLEKMLETLPVRLRVLTA